LSRGRTSAPRLGRRPAQRERGFVTTVHGRGAASLDGMLALTEVASKVAPLDDVLAELTARTAALLGVDVCSIYLCDGPTEGDRRAGGDLVLRATHGLPPEAVGTVRMRVGEGLTGFAVECLRPVSVAMVTSDARNKRFDGLGEERFPALCAMPLTDGGRAVGALVVQRRQPRAFGPREVVLIAACAPPVLLAVDRCAARARAQAREEGVQNLHMPRRPQEVLLRGAAAAAGRALGTLAVRRGRLAGPRASAPGDVALERAQLGRAFADVAAEVAALDAWARPRLDAAGRAGLAASRFLLEDARLRGRAFRHVEAGTSAAAAVERVAREYARVLSDAEEEALRERAFELEGLASRILARLAGDAAALEPGRVLVAARLTGLEAVELASAHGAGAALSGPASASPGVAVARALGLPVVCDVRALFQWAADGDRALVDGEAGTVVINPSRAEVAQYRKG
jgi:phosphotransferase system enzyme I (PtsP)